MRRALVTGASRGIGRAVTEMLLGDGWEVCGLSRTDPHLEHPAFWWAEVDLGERPAYPWELPYVLGVAPFDALVHAAAIRGPYGPLAEANDAAWEQTVSTNLLGTYRVVRAALPLLQRSEDARILLFSGGGAFGPSPGFSAYAAAKAGVVALGETLAEELRGTTVTVNCVAPGFIATGIHAGTPHEGQPDSGTAMATAVETVRHLLSPAARGLTGKTIAAQHDDWRSLDPLTVPPLNDSEMGTRWRRPVAMLRNLIHPPAPAAARVLSHTR